MGKLRKRQELNPPSLSLTNFTGFEVRASHRG
jgi:hypothetical protein